MRAYRKLYEATQAHRALLALWAEMKPWLMAGHRLEVVVSPETRSSAQNARMWAMLSDISRQVNWHGRKLTGEEWKHVFTSALKKQEVVPNLDGTGFVVLGKSTSQMSRSEMSELMELMSAFGAEHSVRFTAPEDQVPA